MVDTDTSTQAFVLQVSSPSQDQIQLVQIGGTLISYLNKAGSAPVMADSGAYDPTTMRWWRLRDTGGMTYWEVSPDGLLWALRAARPGVQGLDAASVQLQLYSTSGAAQQVRVNNINLTP